MTPLEAAVVLGVAPDAAPDEVRAAYRRLIRTHHPDRAGRSSSDRAASITEAYRVLRAAPTGSVWWLDELDATPDALRKLAETGLWREPCDDAARRAEGFNRIAIAAY